MAPSAPVSPSPFAGTAAGAAWSPLGRVVVVVVVLLLLLLPESAAEARGIVDTSRSTPRGELLDGVWDGGGGAGFDVGAEKNGSRATYELHEEDDGAVDGVSGLCTPAGAGADVARACCIQTVRAPWSTGQLSAVGVGSTRGCDGGSDGDGDSGDAAALACSSQASRLLWSTGHVVCCVGEADMVLGGVCGGEEVSGFRWLRKIRSMMSCTMAD